MYSIKHRMGVMVPGNNATLEPEMWSRMPEGVALYASRLMLKGDVTAGNLKGMETEIDRSAAELMATVVDVIMIADMVVSFIMPSDWNDRRTEEITRKYGVPCVTGWTSLHDALRHLGIKRFAMISPYPQDLQALAGPFFARYGFEMTDDRTFDFMDMLQTPMISPADLRELIGKLDLSGAEALLILSTDVPTFESIEPLEAEFGIPVLTQNQAMLWSAFQKIGVTAETPRLGRLFSS